MKRSVVSGLLALLKVERDKIGAAPYDGCLRTLVEGIKPFIVRLGVKVLMTCFRVRPLRSRIVSDLILSRFKVHNMFSAYVTCMVGIEHLFEDNF